MKKNSPDLIAQAFNWNGHRATKWDSHVVQEDWVGVVIKWYMGDKLVNPYEPPQKITTIDHNPYAHAAENVKKLFPSKNFGSAHVSLLKLMRKQSY